MRGCARARSPRRQTQRCGSACIPQGLVRDIPVSQTASPPRAAHPSACFVYYTADVCSVTHLSLQALTSGGGKAEAFSAALASAVASGGCGSVSNVLAQAQASAQSSGKGQAFSQAIAKADAVAKCVQKPKYPNCSTKGFVAQGCCSG